MSIDQRSLEQRFEKLVSHVVADPQLHARWLNTFSFLEYIGCRKIIKSQQAEKVSFATLAHAVEEGRHAMILKKMARRIGGSAFDTYTPEALLRGEDAENYFQSLDRSINEALQNIDESHRSTLVYFYVTWLIEVRALDVYGLYRKALGDMPGAKSLDGLLEEEEQHLSRVISELEAHDPEFKTRSQVFSDLEQQLYEKMLTAFEAGVEHILSAA